LEYSLERLNREFPDTETCVNDLSLQNGGDISGHVSHENGLDIDISYPSSKNNCDRSPRFVNWRWNLEGGNLDEEFFKRNYEFLKIIEETNRVKVIGTDSGFITALCNWTKEQEFSDDEIAQRTRVFNLLRHWSGHANHYHLRVTCNNQNEGCKDFSAYSGRPSCR
jgi:murein endopeptidase